jgi:hypothetical protein
MGVKMDADARVERRDWKTYLSIAYLGMFALITMAGAIDALGRGFLNWGGWDAVRVAVTPIAVWSVIGTWRGGRWGDVGGMVFCVVIMGLGIAALLRVLSSPYGTPNPGTIVGHLLTMGLVLLVFFFLAGRTARSSPASS